MATVVSDFTQSPEKILIDIINAENNTNLTVGDLMFGFPRVLTGDPSHNTRVHLDPTVASKRAGWVFVNYSRVHLDDFVPSDRRSFFIRTSSYRVRDIIPHWNSRWLANFQPRDVVESPFPTFDGLTPTTMTLVAGADSLIYRGSVDLTLKPALLIGTQLTQTLLPGLDLVSVEEDETAEQKLVNLMNQENPSAGYEFRLDNLTMGNPVVASGSGFNTQLLITGIEFTEFYGTVTVRYMRINLAGITPSTGFISEQPFTKAKLVQRFNAEYDSFIREADLLDVDLTTVETGVVKDIVLTAQTNSRGWIGSMPAQIVTGIPDSHGDLHTLLHVTWPGYFGLP